MLCVTYISIKQVNKGQDHQNNFTIFYIHAELAKGNIDLVN